MFLGRGQIGNCGNILGTILISIAYFQDRISACHHIEDSHLLKKAARIEERLSLKCRLRAEQTVCKGFFGPLISLPHTETYHERNINWTYTPAAADEWIHWTV